MKREDAFWCVHCDEIFENKFQKGIGIEFTCCPACGNRLNLMSVTNYIGSKQPQKVVKLRRSGRLYPDLQERIVNAG